MEVIKVEINNGEIEIDSKLSELSTVRYLAVIRLLESWTKNISHDLDNSIIKKSDETETEALSYVG